MSTERYLRIQYELLIPFLEKIGNEIDGLLLQFCKEELKTPEKRQIGPKHRIKEPQKFIEKVYYRDKQYKDPLKNVTDKVGTRLVLLTEVDVTKICSRITTEKQWIIMDHSQGYVQIRNSKPEAFTYLSEHYIVRLRSSFLKKQKISIPNTINKRYLTCEIQVRTLMQHAYAETSHDTVYKGEYFKNKEMIRTLATSMALIETADKKLIKIYKLVEQDQNKINLLANKIVSRYQSFDNEFSSHNYNYDSLLKFLFFLDKNITNVDDISSKIDEFVDRYDYLLTKIIEEQKFQAFKSPLIIIILFAVYNYLPKIQDKWPFSHNILTESKLYLGI